MDQKISQLTAGTPLNTDYIPYVDGVTGTTKKALKSDLKGDTGATGPTGPTGPAGAAGAAATVAAGTTTTSAPGTSASVVNVGTPSAAIFNFTIPRGDTGAAGTNGTDGVSIPWRGAYNPATSYTPQDAVSYNGSSYTCKLATTGNLPTNATYWDLLAQKGADGAGSGTVTSVSVVSANGLAGTVANPTTTPAITLSTTATGVLKGNGTAISAATDGTDYLSPSTVQTEINKNVLLRNATSTALISGGALSINADPTKFDVAAGVMQFIDSYTNPAAPTIVTLNYAGSTGNIATLLASQDNSFISIGSDGTIYQTSTQITGPQLRDRVLLGALVHPSRTAISSVDSYTLTNGVSIGATVADISTSLGVINSGNVFSGNATSGLKIDKSSGTSAYDSINWKNSKKSPNITIDAAQTAATFLYSYRNGSGGFTTSLTDTIVPGKYDNGTGGVGTPNGTVSANQWTLLRIYFSPDAQLVGIEYGQQVYNTLTEATDARSATTVVNPLFGSVPLRAILAVRGGATDLKLSTVDAYFLATDKLGQIPTTVPRSLAGLTDVYIPAPTTGNVLGYNGVNWVDQAPTAASAGAGISFYDATPVITAAGTGNTCALASFLKTPVTTAEQTVTGSTTAGVTTLYAGWLYATALGRTTIDGGNWTFTNFLSVNTLGTTQNVIAQMYQVVPSAAVTVTVTGTGTSRTATASGGTPFAAAGYFSASATNTTASYIQTASGVYQITGRTSDTVVTIATPTGYVNDSAVVFNVWNKLFGASLPNLTSTAVTEYTTTVTQPAYTVNTTDYLGKLYFFVSGGTRTVTSYYNGTSHESFTVTPLTVLHNNLPGLQGGSANQYYHMTNAEYTGTGTGNFVRATSPTLVTPVLGAATATSVNGVGISGTAGKTVTVSNSITLAGTDSTTMTFPTTSASIARTDAAQTFTGTQTFSQQIMTNNAITATANAATVPITSRISTVTNNSAAGLTITMTTTSAVDGMLVQVRVLDFSAVAQTITWVNTENGEATAPATSNGSTTLPRAALFQFNSRTSLWRCIAS